MGERDSSLEGDGRGIVLAWHEDPGVPREGLKPSAVVEEGGKLRARETPLERAGWGLESGPPTRGPPPQTRPRLYLL